MSIQGDKFREIANAIREKEQSTAPIKANDFANRIRALQIGGAGGEYNIVQTIVNDYSYLNIYDADYKFTYRLADNWPDLVVSASGLDLTDFTKIRTTDKAQYKVGTKLDVNLASESQEPGLENAVIEAYLDGTSLVIYADAYVTEHNYITVTNFTNLQELYIDNLIGLPQCGGLTQLSKIEISYAKIGEEYTGFWRLLYNCTALTELDLSNVHETNKISRMEALFEGCTNLQSVNFSNWDTSNVHSVQQMFKGCTSLTEVDLSNFDTSSLTGAGMYGMFLGCTNLQSINFGYNWNTSNLTEIADMFKGCRSLTTITGMNTWDTSSITRMYGMFLGCTSLTELDLRNFVITDAVDGYIILGINDTVAIGLLQQLAPDYATMWQSAVAIDSIIMKRQILTGVIESLGGATPQLDAELALTPSNIRTIYCPEVMNTNIPRSLPYIKNGLTADYESNGTDAYYLIAGQVLTRKE